MSKHDNNKSKLKEFAVVAGGTALGTAAAHTLVQHARKGMYGRRFRRLPPNSRLEVLVPAATGIGVGVFLAGHMKNRARKRLMEKRSFVLDHVYRSLL